MKMMMKKNVEVVAQAAQIDASEYSDSRKFVQRTLQTHSCWHHGNGGDDDSDDGHYQHHLQLIGKPDKR